MSNRTKSVKNLVTSILGHLITIGLGLVLPRLWIVSYGSEVNGLLSSLNQFLVYLGLFEAGVGAATMQALYKPVAQEDWDGINGVLSATNGYYKKTAYWYFIGLSLLALFYPVFVDSSLSYATVFGAVFFSGIGNVVSFFLQGKYNFLLQADGKGYILSVINSITHILNSVCKIVLISLKVNIVVVLVIAFLIQCVQAVYILWYVKRNYPEIRLNVQPNNEAVAQKNYALVHQLSGLIFHNTDVLILTFFCDLKVVSVYSLYKMVTSQIETLIGMAFNSVNFVLGQTYQTNKKLFIHRIDMVESYYSAMVYSFFSVTLFLFLPFVRLYTSGVTDINYVDVTLAILFILCSLLDKGRVPMLHTINYAGHYKETLPQTIIESMINLLVSLLGVYFFGIYGVLAGTVVALAYRTNDIILYANHKLLERSAKKTYSIYLINIVLFVALQGLFSVLFDAAWISSYARFAIAGVSCVCIAFFVIFGAQTLAFRDCREMVFNLLKKYQKKIFSR